MRSKKILKKSVSISFDDELIARIDQRAFQQDLSRSELIRVAVERYLSFPIRHRHQRSGPFWDKLARGIQNDDL